MSPAGCEKGYHFDSLWFQRALKAVLPFFCRDWDFLFTYFCIWVPCFIFGLALTCIYLSFLVPARHSGCSLQHHDGELWQWHFWYPGVWCLGKQKDMMVIAEQNSYQQRNKHSNTFVAHMPMYYVVICCFLTGIFTYWPFWFHNKTSFCHKVGCFQPLYTIKASLKYRFSIIVILFLV